MKYFEVYTMTVNFGHLKTVFIIKASSLQKAWELCDEKLGKCWGMGYGCDEISKETADRLLTPVAPELLIVS